MNDSIENPISQIARDKMVNLRSLGSQEYNEGQLEHAEKTYKNAMELAFSINDIDAITEYRFWCGTCQFERGHLRLALATLSPNLQDTSFSKEPDYVYRTLTNYLGIAIDLAISLDHLQKVIDNTDDFLRSINHLDWRPRLLYQQSRLYYLRGMYTNALNLALECWSISENAVEPNFPNYNDNIYLNHIINTYLKLNNNEQAKKYLSEWEHRPVDIPLTRELMISSAKTLVSLEEGKSRDAIDWGRNAALVAKQYEDKDEFFQAISVLLIAFLSDEDILGGRSIMKDLIKIHNSENRHQCYELNKLFGDFHLAYARVLAGISYTYSIKQMPAFLKVQSNLKRVVRDIFKPLSTKKLSKSLCTNDNLKDQSALIRREINRARFCLNHALKVGKDIDDHFECDIREKEIRDKLIAVDQTAQSIMD